MKEGANKKEYHDEKTGRFLSYILRHHPETVDIVLDAHGWADVGELLEGAHRAGYPIEMSDLERIVATNSKKRYSFNQDHTRIRANQGHSVNVDLELKQVQPPDLLYHGTAERFLGEIRREGISRQSRQYVHLSADTETAVEVGKRHGEPVVLVIDAARMAADGTAFYRSENGVWLCDKVDWKYVIKCVTRSGREIPQ